MIRGKLRQLMAGRSGGDQLSLATLWGSVLLQLIATLLGWEVLNWIALALLIYTIFRMLSRRIDDRRAENARFLALIRPLRQKFSSARIQLQDKEHRYFRCPNCKQQMRVPRGKGRIQVTCRGCGVTFEEKS